jgi:signal transduction histidine kinase
MSSELTPTDARRLRYAERLLACFQKALGHELPNQLVAIQGLSCLLQQDEADRLSPEGRECLGRQAAAVRRTHALVNELAEVGRAGRLALAGGCAVLGEVVREAAAEVNQLAPAPAIEYHIANPHQVLSVPETSLRQVLVALLGHAARGPAARVEVGARATPGGVELWVADDRPALELGAAEGLFEPFPPAANAGAGGPLGLFLCSLLAEAWGGTLTVLPQPGRGTRFLLSIPACP